MRNELAFRRKRRRLMPVAVLALAGPLALAPRMASAEGLFDFLFGGIKKQSAAQASFFADPFGLNPQAAPPSPRGASGSGPAFACAAATASIFR